MHYYPLGVRVTRDGWAWGLTVVCRPQRPRPELHCEDTEWGFQGGQRQ